MLQEDIATKLAVTQPEVSRLLRIARDANWLQPAPSIVRHTVPDAIWERVDQEYFSAPGDLAKRVNTWAPAHLSINVHVVSTGPTSIAISASTFCISGCWISRFWNALRCVVW